MIQIKAEMFVGIKFSDICKLKYDEDNKPYHLEFPYHSIENLVKKSFKGKEIPPGEVTPELLSLVLDLDFSEVQYSHEAYLGHVIRDLDIGTDFVAHCDTICIETTKREIKNKLKEYIAEEDLKSMINLVLLGSMHSSKELFEVEE